MRWGDLKVGDVAAHGGLGGVGGTYLVVKVGEKRPDGIFTITAVELETGTQVMSAGHDDDLHENFTVLRNEEELP